MRRVAVSAAVAGAALLPMASPPAHATVFCHGVGTLLTSDPLHYGVPRSTTFLASTVQPAGCSMTGSLTNATCAGGTTFDGTPIALQPVSPALCSPTAAGETHFFFEA